MSGQLQGAGGVGGLLSVTAHNETGDSAYYPSYDANGNISEYVDDSDSVVAHYEYSPFGKITSSSGSKADDFNHRFSTKYLDDETSLYYYGYRYYSSELGRWLSRDPIGERGGLNTYAFISNSSVNLYDFLGMRSCEDSGGTVKNETCCCGNKEFIPEEKCCKNGEIETLDRIKVVERVEGSPGFGGNRFEGVDALVGDLEMQTGTCTCIKKLVISNHSGLEGSIPLGELYLSNPPEYCSKADMDSIDFRRIKSTLCDGATIEIRMCRALGGKAGRRQGQWLANQTEANVEGYAGSVSPYGTVAPFIKEADEDERHWFPARKKRSFCPE